jgi:lipopolysaccharide/colanic/teichoic acid biosynthesis glycosyltransferase
VERERTFEAGTASDAVAAQEVEPVEADLLYGPPAPSGEAAGAAVIDLRSAVPIVELPDLERRQLHLFETAGLLAAPRWKLGVKRAFDIAGAALALLLLSPVLAAVSLAVAVSSRGPILFKQERIGRNGEPFTFWKFRSMYRDAEERRAALRAVNEKSGPIFKIRNDPRMTPIGRMLRRWSLDELPQFVHVLTGQMSLVGPRPPLPHEVDEYDERAWGRLRAKPGITCIWQVSGRSDLDFDTWISMDLEYIQEWSLGLDLRLLAATVPAVLSGRGAY